MEEHVKYRSFPTFMGFENITRFVIDKRMIKSTSANMELKGVFHGFTSDNFLRVFPQSKFKLNIDDMCMISSSTYQRPNSDQNSQIGQYQQIGHSQQFLGNSPYNRL